jgi:Domain of unknown function (DUF4276)
MPEPAFLVDGVMEQRIIGHICRGKTVQRLNCNGTDTPLGVIVNRVEFHIRILNNRYSPIIVLIDREKRRKTCGEIADEISRLLNGRGYSGQFLVSVVDRCIENWILADWSSVTEHFQKYGIRTAPANVRFEGKQGKAELKKLLPRELLYNEPTWGKDMFLSCRPDRIYQNSASFRTFVDQLSLPCPWLSGVSDRFRPIYE